MRRAAGLFIGFVIALVLCMLLVGVVAHSKEATFLVGATFCDPDDPQDCRVDLFRIRGSDGYDWCKFNAASKMREVGYGYSKRPALVDERTIVCVEEQK